MYNDIRWTTRHVKIIRIVCGHDMNWIVCGHDMNAVNILT